MRQRSGRPRNPDGQVVLDEHNGYGKEDVVVEVKETLPEDVDMEVEQQQDQRVLAIERLQQETEEAENPDRQQDEQQNEEGMPPAAEAASQPAPWEVRAEGVRTGEDHVENPDDETRKPISRAERRKLIKEEIQRLSHGEQPLYYQRRLW